MKVQRVIDELQKCDPDSEVVFKSSDENSREFWCYEPSITVNEHNMVEIEVWEYVDPGPQSDEDQQLADDMTERLHAACVYFYHHGDEVMEWYDAWLKEDEEERKLMQKCHIIN